MTRQLARFFTVKSEEQNAYGAPPCRRTPKTREFGPKPARARRSRLLVSNCALPNLVHSLDFCDRTDSRKRSDADRAVNDAEPHWFLRRW
jgi:hypothetical protein